MKDLRAITKAAQGAIAAVKDVGELEELRIRYLGRKAELTALLRGIKDLSESERKEAGARANAARKAIEAALAERRRELAGAASGGLAGSDWADLTEQRVRFPQGHIHPTTQVIEEVIDVFHQLGFAVAEGPEVETDWYNFEALGIPPEHPARDMQDTFYLENGMIPRTHTSSVQIRYMEEHEPPVRIIAPGRCYRNEDEDSSHVWIFHQLEGLAIDRGLTMADLKGTLEAMVRGVVGEDAQLRLRPSYFPYTEPSAEMDVTCPRCGGSGCRACGRTGWMELGGAGMVHPQVLRNVGYDPDQWQGFAFGFGPERLAMAKYDVTDARLFWRTDLRFLEQF